LRADEVEPWVRAGVVDWPGHVGDVRPWLSDADVFVLPSYYREGVPRSIQEAMACALPIVTTDSVGCRDTVEPGKNGFLVPPRSVDALSAAMERFLTTPGLARRMGRASRAIAEIRFDAAAFDRKMIDLLVGAAP
jgi:glycosyltransferase involved in cell wall biosynthesis